MQEIAVIPKFYDVILWFSHKINKYPKTYKYSLGERLNNTLFEIIELIIEAKYSSKKKEYFLRKANINLEKLRYMIRLSKDLQCITLKDYEYISRNINEVGKMLGGWEKHSKSSATEKKEAE